VAPVPPPSGEFLRTERVGGAWLAWLSAKPWVDCAVPDARIELRKNHGRAEIAIDSPARTEVVIRETWDPGWSAHIDGKPAVLGQKWGVFLRLDVEKGLHNIILEYNPIEVRSGIAVSIVSSAVLILVLTGIGKL